MKLLLIFFILIFSSTSAYTKEKFNEKCDGFCEGENLKIETHAYPQPSYRIINGKKKKSPMWVITRAARKENSLCIPFDSYINRVVPRKLKKKDFEKHMEDYRQGTDIFETTYSINSCRPCPAGMKSPNKTGYCTITMIFLQVMYKTGWDKGYYDPNTIDFTGLGLGRDYSPDVLVNLSEAIDKIALEYLNFPVSMKKDLSILRFKDKATDEIYYAYSYLTYKTSAKVQVRKETQMQMLQDQNLINYLDDYIENMQSTYTAVFDPRNNDYKNISKLYELIPSDEELDLFKSSFKDVATFHIQNRN